MMLGSLTFVVQVYLFMDLSAALFQEDYTGDIIWDPLPGSAPGAAEVVTGKLCDFLPGGGWVAFKLCYWFTQWAK